MKFFATLFSLYILFLVAFPCADKPDGNMLQKTEISKSSTSSSMPDLDQCSPFCVCSCCVSGIIHQVFVLSFDNLTVTHYRFPELVQSFHFARFASIWQPPQLN